jgi:hypothetical protein
MRRRATIGLSQSLARTNPAKEFLSFLGLAGTVGTVLFFVNEPLTSFLYKRRVQLQDGVSSEPIQSPSSQPSKASSSFKDHDLNSTTPPTRGASPSNESTEISDVANTSSLNITLKEGEENIDEEVHPILETLNIPLAVVDIENNKTEQLGKTKLKEEHNKMFIDAVVVPELSIEDVPEETNTISKPAQPTDLIEPIHVTPLPTTLPPSSTTKEMIPEPSPKKKKRRVYKWDSFSPTPALEMHRNNKKSHYLDGRNSNTAGTDTNNQSDLSKKLLQKKRQNEKNVQVKEIM